MKLCSIPGPIEVGLQPGIPGSVISAPRPGSAPGREPGKSECSTEHHSVITVLLQWCPPAISGLVELDGGAMTSRGLPRPTACQAWPLRLHRPGRATGIADSARIPVPAALSLTMRRGRIVRCVWSTRGSATGKDPRQPRVREHLGPPAGYCSSIQPGAAAQGREGQECEVGEGALRGQGDRCSCRGQQ